MGCNTSRLNDLPAVSLCRDRCKFLEEALCQSRALADAHVAYTRSLMSLGPTLRRFLDQNPKRDCAPGESAKVAPYSRPASPDHCPSTSNSESHIDFPSDNSDNDDDDEEEELFRDDEEDFDLLHGIHTNYFDHRNPHSFHNDHNTPSPPAPPSSTWDFLNFFEPLDRYEAPAKEKVARCQVAEKKDGVSEKEKSKESSDPAPVRDDSKDSSSDVVEITREVEALFGRAAESGNEVLEMLDAANSRYFNKNYVFRGASSKILQAVTPSFFVLSTRSFSSATEKVGSVDGDLDVVSVNLSSTLKKLWMWEKKLYDEVKAEEKLRIMIARNYKQMTSLGGKGAEAGKLESLLMALSTKIQVAIQVIDKISVAVNESRDQELWPQIHKLITKLLGMWKAMLECHRCQFQAVSEARSLDAVTSDAKFSDAYLESAIQLNIELQYWTLTFSNWITAQRGYAKALNAWLLKHLPCEPEEMPDGNSPSSNGPPPIFVFCQQWSQAMDKVSEMEVIDAMHKFLKGINQIVERHCAYNQQRPTADKDLEKKIKVLEREEIRIQKMMQARGMMFLAEKNASSVSLAEDTAHQSNHKLQLGLKQIFMALDRFCVTIVQAYEELHMHLEEHIVPTREI